ncbi:MAG: hypothetical protein ACI9WU_001526 [Myxococcota bacterium]|jgi:hypothetical protein
MRTNLWIRGAVALSLAFAIGCSSDDEEVPAEAGTTDGTTGGTTDAPGPFNYVPLNDNVCEPSGEDAEQLTIGNKLNELNLDFDTAAATGLQLCATCEGNELADALAAITADVMIGGAAVSPPLVDHVNTALAFPYRELLVGYMADEDGDFDIALAQGIRNNPGSYTVQVESLADGCEDWDVSMFATVTRTGEDDDEVATATTASASDRPFGFLVPATLPDLDAATDEEIAEALDAANGLGIALEEPSLSFTVNADGGGEGTLTGWVQLGSLNALADAGADLGSFAKEDATRLKAVLSFTLEPASVQSAIDVELYENTEAVADTAPGGKPGVAHARLVKTPLGKQQICLGSLEEEVDLQIVHIQGASGEFDLEGFNGRKPVINRRILNRAAKLSVVASNDEGENPTKTVRFTRRWRKGAGFDVRPACVDQIAAGEAPEQVFAEDGWFEIRWRPIGTIEKGCARSVWICQEFTAEVCGPNSTVDEDGLCACGEGFEAAFDECVKREDVKDAEGKTPHADALLGKDLEGKVIAACRSGLVGNGFWCAPNPCDADESPCDDESVCVLKTDEEVAADNTSFHNCVMQEEEDDQAPVTMNKRQMLALLRTAADKADGHENEIEDEVAENAEDDDEGVDPEDAAEAAEGTEEGEGTDEEYAESEQEAIDAEAAGKPGFIQAPLHKARRARKRRARYKTTLGIVFYGRDANGKRTRVRAQRKNKVLIGRARVRGRTFKLYRRSAARSLRIRSRGSRAYMDIRGLSSETMTKLKDMKRITTVKYRTKRFRRRFYRGKRIRPVATSPYRYFRVKGLNLRGNRARMVGSKHTKYAKRKRARKVRKSRRTFRRKGYASLAKAKRVTRIKRRYRRAKRRSSWGRRMRARR